MKEASGELNMTVVTIIAIGAILAFFWFMFPIIKNSIGDTWNKATSTGDDITMIVETNR